MYYNTKYYFVYIYKYLLDIEQLKNNENFNNSLKK